MSALLRLWNSYWFRPAPLLDLAVVRIVLCAFSVHYLIRIYPELALHAELPGVLYEPVLAVRLISTTPPSLELIMMVFWITALANLGALIGSFTRTSLGLLFAGKLFLQGYLYSFGDYHHPDALFNLSFGLLALAPSGELLSFDAWRRRRHLDPRAAQSTLAAWPLLCMRWLLSLSYLSAAFSKLLAGGLGWANGYTIQYYLVRDYFRFNTDLGLWLASQPVELAIAMQWASLLFEACFFLVLIFPRLALLFLPVGVGMHLGIWVLMGAGFFQFIWLYVVFVPITRVLRWRRRAS